MAASLFQIFQALRRSIDLITLECNMLWSSQWTLSKISWNSHRKNEMDKLNFWNGKKLRNLKTNWNKLQWILHSPSPGSGTPTKLLPDVLDIAQRSTTCSYPNTKPLRSYTGSHGYDPPHKGGNNSNCKWKEMSWKTLTLIFYRTLELFHGESRCNFSWSWPTRFPGKVSKWKEKCWSLKSVFMVKHSYIPLHF